MDSNEKAVFDLFSVKNKNRKPLKIQSTNGKYRVVGAQEKAVKDSDTFKRMLDKALKNASYG